MLGKGSFVGFTYGTEDNLIHSSDLGIIRVSDGSRYNDNLLPSIKDTIQTMTGRDGKFYFGTTYEQKLFSLQIAFDSLTESQLRKIKQLFGEKGVHYLIFDECPYKIYTVRVQQAPSLKFIAFDQATTDNEYTSNDDLYSVLLHSSNERVYKGEGTLNFIGYTPYAVSRYKYIDQYILKNIPEWGDYTDYTLRAFASNINEWKDSINLKHSNFKQTVQSREYTLDTIDLLYNNGNILLYNPGDFSTTFNYDIFLKNLNRAMPSVTFTLQTDDGNKTLSLESFNLSSSDVGYRINTHLHLIEGLKTNNSNVYTPSGVIYNQYITEGDFFEIPILKEPQVMYVDFNDTSNISSINMDYKYKFL